MDPALRKAYNAAYTEEHHRSYMGRLEGRLGHHVPFRVAETPLFLEKSIRGKLERAAREVVDLISDPRVIERGRKAIPPHLNVPNEDALSSCIQVDFAIAKGKDGELDVKLVELQGFPSLYCLIALQVEALSIELEKMGMGGDWTTFFGGLDRKTYLDRLRAALLGDTYPGEVVLLDLEPEKQKTFVDFIATKILLGIDPVCPSELERDGRKLYRRVQGRRVQVKRIYNRIVFDELEKSNVKMPFQYTDDLDVSWVPHPNWYWTWSKHTIPMIEHPSVPRARLLSEVDPIPDDLESYVLKPLFSFAGTGVIVDVTRADIDGIPADQRSGWLLQEKIDYAFAFETPGGAGVKSEVRMMFLRGPGQAKPELVMNLVRLSRGKLIGVDHNKNLDWVGGTVGIWRPGE
jgi:hypothetical protein